MSTLTVQARPALPAAPLRLTRRGQRLLTVLALLAAVAVVVLTTGGGLAAALTPGSGSDVAVQRVTVRPGETLWAIAERSAPGVDPRETVAELMDLNALTTSVVPAGSVLLLPAG